MVRKWVLILAIIGLVWTIQFAAAAEITKTYTTNADFDLGELTSVEHSTVANQLQLSHESTTLPFIWIPNLNQGGTVSKVDTVTGKELGRYHTGPVSVAGSPSRTTVDLQGNVWVGNRDTGTVVKIGLEEAGTCADRNHNGIINTSRDLNADGIISGDEMLPWGSDECVLHEVVVIPGSEGTYVPGAYTGSYSSIPGPRSFAIDAKNNLWAGTLNTNTFYYVNGTSGVIEHTYHLTDYGITHTAYGATIDRAGIVWSSGDGSGDLLRIDPTHTPLTFTQYPVGHWVYGLGQDYKGNLFIAGWDSAVFTKYDITTNPPTKLWDHADAVPNGRGVVCTADNNTWVALTYANQVRRFNNDGTLLATINGFNAPTGVAVDAAGKVWVTNLNDDYIHRINPATNAIDLSKALTDSGGHYTYSDMTGMVSRTITTRIGTWTVIYDSTAPDTQWGPLSWTAVVPEDTSLDVTIQSSNTLDNWSSPETARTGMALASTPGGRYAKVRVTFQSPYGSDSPVLKDITINGDTTAEDEGDYQIALSPGWNFVSVPKTLKEGNNTAMIFKDVETDGHSIWGYDASGRRWFAFTGATKIKVLDGFWIYSKDLRMVPLLFSRDPLQTPPIKACFKGWNAIGSSDISPTPARQSLLSVKNEWTQIIGFDERVQEYETSIVNGATGIHSDGKMMLPTKGYWLYMINDNELPAIGA